MKYKVYVLLDDIGRPYYVGMTNNMTRRRKEHIQEMMTGNPLPKYNRARDLLKKGHKFKMRAIAKSNSVDTAFRLERMYIKKFRAMNYVMMNCTHGGPDEKPLRINKPKKQNKKAMKLPNYKKVPIHKKGKVISRARRRS